MSPNRRLSIVPTANSPVIESLGSVASGMPSMRRASVLEPKFLPKGSFDALFLESKEPGIPQQGLATFPNAMRPQPASAVQLKAGQMSRQHPYCPHCGNHVEIVDGKVTSDSDSSRSRSNSGRRPLSEAEALPLLSPMSFRSGSSSQRRANAPLPSETTASPQTPSDWQQGFPNHPPRSAGLPHPPLCSPREKQRLTRKTRAISEINANELRQNVSRWMQRSADFSAEPTASPNALGLSVDDETKNAPALEQMAERPSSAGSDQYTKTLAILTGKPTRPSYSPLRQSSPPAAPSSARAAELSSSNVSTPTGQNGTDQRLPQPAHQESTAPLNIIPRVAEERVEDRAKDTEAPNKHQSFPALDVLSGPGFPSDEADGKVSSLYLRRQARQSTHMEADNSSSTIREELAEEPTPANDTAPELVSHDSETSSCLSSRRPSQASTNLLGDYAEHGISSAMNNASLFPSHAPMLSKIPGHDEEVCSLNESVGATNFATGEEISRNDLMESLAEAIELPKPSTKIARQQARSRPKSVALQPRPRSAFIPRSSRPLTPPLPAPVTPRNVTFQTSDARALLRQSRISGSVDSLLSDSTNQTIRRRASGNASGLPAPLISADIMPSLPPSYASAQGGRARGYSFSDARNVPNVANFVSDAIEEQAAVMKSRPVSIIERQRRASQIDPFSSHAEVEGAPTPAKTNRFSRRFSRINLDPASAREQIPDVPALPPGILLSQPSASPAPRSPSTRQQGDHKRSDASAASVHSPTTPRPNAVAERAVAKAGESSGNPQVTPRRRASFVNLMRSRRNSSAAKVAIPGVTPK